MEPSTSAKPILTKRGKLLVLLALLLIASGIAFYLPKWRAEQDRVALGKMSVVQLEQRIAANPADTEATYQLGLAYAKAGSNAEAIRTFLNVLEKEPTHIAALNDLGVTYLLQERYSEAQMALQGALQVNPDYAPAIANLGRLHIAVKMPFTASKELKRATELDPKSVATLCDLGEAYQQTLNFNSAEKVYRDAIKRQSDSIVAYIGLGKTLVALNRFDEAVQALQKATELDPKSAQALLTLARILIEKTGASQQDIEEAEKMVKKALESEPDNADGWYDMGRIALRKDKPEEAVEHLKTAIRLAPMQNNALNQMERALRAAGRTQEADRTAKVLRERALREREETRLEEVVERNPEDWDSQAKLAKSYLLSGKRGFAALIISKLQQYSPIHPELPSLLQALQQARGGR